MTIPEQMYAALKAWQFMDDAHANCEECEGLEMPETCPTCFPLADDARCQMTAAIQRAEQEGGYDHEEVVTGKDH